MRVVAGIRTMDNHVTFRHYDLPERRIQNVKIKFFVQEKSW